MDDENGCVKSPVVIGILRFQINEKSHTHDTYYGRRKKTIHCRMNKRLKDMEENGTALNGRCHSPFLLLLLFYYSTALVM